MCFWLTKEHNKKVNKRTESYQIDPICVYFAVQPLNCFSDLALEKILNSFIENNSYVNSGILDYTTIF